MHPKLASSNFQPVVGMLKRILGDSNINVILCGIKIFSVLAKGLRKNFFISAKSFFGVLLQKFKEKKTNIIEETHKTLENFIYCITLDDVIDDIKEAC